ncbi:MAG: hypothetical protein V1874_12315 [Spirochaetota bacterium]
MKRYFSRATFISFIIIIFYFPLAQMKLNIIKSGSLNGVIFQVQYPELNLTDLLSGKYQSQFNDWWNQNFGLRAEFTKTCNQFYYAMFHETRTGSDVFVERDKQLIEHAYLDVYFQNLTSTQESQLEQYVIELKKAQDLLKQRGKALLLVIAPVKSFIYPEYIPHRLTIFGDKAVKNGYDVLIPLLGKYGVNYVDGDKITREHKQTDNFPMFSHGSVHWNHIAADYTTIAMYKKIGVLLNKSVPQISIKSIVGSSAEGDDIDLARLLNVWHPPINYLAPQVQINVNENAFKPSIVINGDSFFTNMIYTLNKYNLFNYLDFYFYYSTHIQYMDGVVNNLGNSGKMDWNSVLSHDAVVIEIREGMPLQIGDGFIHDLLTQLEPKKLNFSHINTDYVTKVQDGDSEKFIFKKGARASDTLYLDTDTLSLGPGKKYTLSYTANGFSTLVSDLYHDDLPKYRNTNITDTPTGFSFDFTSDSPNMKNAKLRFFINGLAQFTDKDTIIYDIKLTERTK